MFVFDTIGTLFPKIQPLLPPHTHPLPNVCVRLTTQEALAGTTMVDEGAAKRAKYKYNP